MRMFTDLDDNIARYFIQDVIELDKLCYEEHLLDTFDSVYNRYLANKNSYVLIYDNDTLVGYICYFPISNTLYNKIYYDNIFVDTDIKSNDIVEYKEGESHNIFIISIAVHPNYRHRGISQILFQGMFNRIRHLKNNGVYINNIVAFAVSQAGEKCLLNNNFEKIKEIYEGISLYEYTR